MDPSRISLVNTRCTRGHALGQRADGYEAAHDGMRVLLPDIDSLHERLVAVGLCLDWVVSKTGEHTVLEGTYPNLGLSDSSHVIRWNAPDRHGLGFTHVGVPWARRGPLD